MFYAILAYHVEDELLAWTPEQDAAVVSKVIEVQAPLRASGHFGPAARLDDTQKAKTLRGPGAGMVLDGPFAETKEQLLGFHLVNYDTEEEAISAARKLREVNPSAVYEIRPVKLYVPADSFGGTRG
ncbi:YciI family protein [Bradyrhizobium betae]